MLLSTQSARLSHKPKWAHSSKYSDWRILTWRFTTTDKLLQSTSWLKWKWTSTTSSWPRGSVGQTEPQESRQPTSWRSSIRRHWNYHSRLQQRRTSDASTTH